VYKDCEATVRTAKLQITCSKGRKEKTFKRGQARMEVSARTRSVVASNGKEEHWQLEHAGIEEGEKVKDSKGGN